MMIIVYTGLTVIMVYFITLFLLSIKWTRISPPRLNEVPSTVISVIIAMRNEEKNIDKCIQGIITQDYPAHLLEIILVDDHSEDQTYFEARKALVLSPFTYKLISLTHGEGKKAALKKGIDAAKGELIVTTDADCKALNEKWLFSIGSLYEMQKPELIIGPVKLEEKSSFFNSFQQLEMMGLATVTGGTATMNHPILCNGANLAFTKKAFLAVEGYSGNENVSSGDDVFLLKKIHDCYPGKTAYLKSPDALVVSNASRNLADFVRQRLRWSGKAAKVGGVLNIYLGLLVLIVSALFVVFIVWSCLFTELAKYLILGATLKCLIDFLLVFLAASSFKARRAIWWFPLAMLINPVYVCLITVLGFVFKPKWKGRKIN